METILVQIYKKEMKLPFLGQFLFTLIPFLLILYILISKFSPKSINSHLPPSPKKLPVLGHMHLLGKYPHRSLRSLAQKHGPMMMLQLGSVQTLVVSSPETAQEIMKTHDLSFANRPESEIARKLLYNLKSLSVAPYGEYWRQLKSTCVLQLLSNKRVQSNYHIRSEETELLIDKIRASDGLVNLSDMFMVLTNDVICRSSFGRKYSEGESGKKFKEIMSEFICVLGGFDFGTFLPWLGWIDHVNGLNGKVKRIGQKLDEFFEGVLEEHWNADKKFDDGKTGQDFADVLLEIYRNNNNVSAGNSIDRDSVKALLLDIISGGTDTTYTVLEWAMTELLRHPTAMKNLQMEVRTILTNGKSEISEKDLEKMNYLKAVIKETLRLHPPTPLLVPREAINHTKVMGFDIPAKTMVIINAFAIGRDPISWDDDPEEFRPERFLKHNSGVDFRGHDFQLIPFGAGRRGCPGISFAMATIETVLANLMVWFDWSLPNGEDEGLDLDMTECPGVTIHKKIPLYAVATPTN
ncbi:OLC1v1013342C1 [Oldenlandia corymbosa var. corymbosa]|uniref:OLC1v1013342C1 n=1 Tax=Oldenlandia corymbosa var. corymbosa TaxID=529605 RepID=A0AAV1E041_OLDCO|nr:OLC1v1013342C1 [Oldenlandia corymbosa var. corymbosa]